MSSLAIELFREVHPGLFRVLAGPNARTYVDVLDALELESTQRHEGMSREEALAIVMDVLEQHPDFLPGQEEMGADEAGEFVSLPPKERARRVLEYLARKDVGWVEDVQLPDWQRRVRFDAHGAILLDALRRIARPDAAVFTDPFVGVCAILANVDAFAKEPFSHLENCLKGATDGLRELRGMGKSIERFIRRQLEARTLGESYAVVFDQYAEQVGHECYAGLVRAQLPARLDAGWVTGGPLGHALPIETVRDALLPHRRSFPIFVGKVLNCRPQTRSSHLTLKQVYKLKAELDRLKTFQCDDPKIDQEMRYLRGQMKQLVRAALRFSKPIAM
jgi:hypothetical protein